MQRDTSKSAMQFSLRTLLLVVTAAAVACSLTKWLHELGIAISMLSVGIVLLGIGIWQKRKSYIVGGSVLIGALILLSPWLLTRMCWVGHRKVSISVCVQDPSGTPVPNAVVRLTDKNSSSTAMTDSKGMAVVTGEFQTCGTNSLLKKTGIIELLGEQLTVQAVDFKTFHREVAEIVPDGCWDLYAPSPPRVEVELEPGKQKPVH